VDPRADLDMTRAEVISDKYLRDILEGRLFWLTNYFLIFIQKQSFSLGRLHTSLLPLAMQFKINFS
jgi:hypothetical protein